MIVRKGLVYNHEVKRHTAGSKLVIASIPQFQKNGAVPNRALTFGTPRISYALLTSGKFLQKQAQMNRR